MRRYRRWCWRCCGPYFSDQYARKVLVIGDGRGIIGFVTLTNTAMKPKTAAAPASAKAPGRPPKGSRAMTHAERQRAYRDRQRAAVMTAYGTPAGQPTPAILAALGRLLVQLDDPEKARDHDTVRSMAGAAVRELVTRYKLKPGSSR